MPDSNGHRAAILDSIRHALGKRESDEAIAAEYATITRSYTRTGSLDREHLLDLFTDRLLEYDAGVYRAAPGSIRDVIAEILTSRGKHGLAIPLGIPTEWLPAGFAFDVAEGWDAYRLDKAEGILTGCAVAIAETGSIVLQNAPQQGARILSLVPDYHLCVVFADQIVETVPESFARIQPTLPTTFISGPSATADIEMTRIKGVHGPRFFDVVIVTV